MPEILTTNFKSDTTRLFIDSLASDEYYLFVSSISTFDPDNTQFSKNQFLEKTLFGKKILTDDIYFMIKYYPWQKGLVYTEYDDRVDLTGVNFYAVVGPNDNDTGDYRLYKCIRNNNGTAVSNPPNHNSAQPDQIYETADGYVWKYIYAISDLEFEAYNALGYIPITGTFNSNPPATTGGEISDVVVDNSLDNFGYVVETGGLVGNPFTTGDMIVDPSTTWSPIPNYYVGQYIYTTNPTNGISRLFEIEYYEFNITTGNALIRVGQELLTGAANPVVAGVLSTANFSIFPKIKITGDGTGAYGIPNIVNNRIDSITMLTRGSNYRNAVVEVIDPAYDFNPEDITTTDVRVIARARISPDGGHGYNLIDEFKCRHFLLYAYITAEDNTQIGYTNTYGAVGIVRSPEFAATSPTVFDNRIAIVTDDIDRVTANTIVIQLDANNETVFSGVVHEVDFTSNTFYIAEYMGPYQNIAGTGNGDTSLDLNLLLRNETGQTIQINSPVNTNVTVSEYIQRTGEVYFMENFLPLERTDLSREEFKFVLEY